MADNDNILATGVKNYPHINVFDKMTADRFAAIPLEVILVYLIDIVQADALPVLGQQFDVMGYKGWLLAATEAEKRDLIKKAIELHRRKGTPWAVKEAIKRFGYDNVQIDERLDDLLNYYNGARNYDGTHIYGGDFHWAYFRVIVDISNIATPVNSATAGVLVKLIYEYKPVRSWLYDLTFGIYLDDQIATAEVLEMESQFALVDDLPAQIFYNGQYQYNGQQQYDFDVLIVNIINVADENFDYEFDFDLQ